MPKHSYLFIISAIFVSYSFAAAGIIRVPQDQISIQAGIDAAVNGDTVLVADSIYYENINFAGKAITVASYFRVDGDTSHISGTIINGSQPADPDKGSVVGFTSGEDTSSVLCGFTITGGSGTVYSESDKIGGGIFCENSGARIIHNKITANAVTYHMNSWGGGIGVFPLQNTKAVIVENNVIAVNSVRGDNGAFGGGISFVQGRIIDNKISQNSCSAVSQVALGGGIRTACDMTLPRTLVFIAGNNITENQATCPVEAGGGGVDVWMNTIILDRNLVSYNKVGTGNCYVPGINIAYAEGISKIMNNIVSFNSPVSGNCDGGGLGLYMTEGVEITGNDFEGNTGYRAGGMGDWQSTGTKIAGNRFVCNAAEYAAGALYTFKTSGTVISENIFSSNAAKYGGGICAFRISDGNISDNKIFGNRTGIAEGGGIFCQEVTATTVMGNLLRHNKAHTGGGLFAYNSDLSITNNLFLNNEARRGGGISLIKIVPIPYPVKMVNNTIAANVADSAGGISMAGPAAMMINSITWGNSASFAPEILLEGGALDVSYSDIRFGIQGIVSTDNGTVNWLDGMIENDPLFSDSVLAGNDTIYCRLARNSPCIDTGDPDYLYNDLDGSRNDMGVYGGPAPLIITDSDDHSKSRPVPQKCHLSQNYPNPFNPSTTIAFTLPRPEYTTLRIYNILGAEVATLVAAKLQAGRHKYTFDGSRLASGVYYYQVTAGAFRDVKKMMLLR